MVSRCGSAKLNGRRRTESTMVKMAVLAPNPERKRRDCDGGETRRAPQEAQRIADILPQLRL